MTSRPAKVIDNASGFSRLPRHAGHSVLTMYCCTRFFIEALSVVANVCSTYLRAPVKVPM